MSTIDRRALLRAGLLLPTAGALAACTAGPPASHEQSGSTLIGPVSPQVRATEARRTRSGRTRAVTLTATAGTVDLGGPMVTTWTYDGLLPGREIRASRGDVIEARLVNRLPSDTTVHWHGLALRNDMDGVPGVTQATVRPGAGFTYRFTAAAAEEAAAEPAAHGAIADLPAAHIAPHRDHLAGALPADDEGQSGLVLIFALHHQNVGKIHRRGAHADAQRIGTKRRQVNVFDAKRGKLFGGLAAEKRLHAALSGVPPLLLGASPGR